MRARSVPLPQRRLVQVGADGGVAAGDVEADAHDRHLVAIGGDATDRHDVPHVSVGHQRGPLGALRHILQLTDRQLVVFPKDHRHLYPHLAGAGAMMPLLPVLCSECLVEAPDPRATARR